MERIAFLMFAIGTFACVPTRELELPADPEAASTLIAIFPQVDSLPILIATSSRTPRFVATTIPDTGEVSIEVLSFRWTLEELQIEGGPITALSEGRPLPRPSKIFVRRVEDELWQERDAISRALDLVRVGAIDPSRCANDGGCFENPDEDDHCTIPCPGPREQPQPPLAPMPPRIVTGTCSDGNEGVVIDGERAPTCFPPKRLARACPPGSYQEFRAAVCSPISSPCPSGRYAEDLPRPADEIRYIVEGDDLPGIAAAAPEGAMLLLSNGLHSGGVTLKKGQTLWGKCPEQTTVTGSVFTATTGVLIGNLTSTAPTGVWAAPNSEVRIERAVFDSLGPHAVFTEQIGNATVTMERVLIRRTGGWALWLSGGSAILRDVVMEDVGATAISAFGGAQLDLARVAIRMNAETGQAGLLVDQPGTRVTAVDLSIEDSVGDSVRITDRSNVRFDRLFVSNVVRESGEAGAGVGCSNSKLELYGAVIEKAGLAGISIHDASTATIAWVSVRDTQPWAGDGATGYGIAVLNQGRAKIFDVLVERITNQAVRLGFANLTSVEDAIVRDTRPDDRDLFGAGLYFQASNGRIRRVRIDRSYRYAILSQSRSSVVLADVDIRDVTLPALDDEQLNYSAGIRLHDSLAHLARVSIADAGGDGLSTGSATLVVEDLNVAVAGRYAINVFEPISTSIHRAQARGARSGARFDDTPFIGGPRPRALVEDLSIAAIGSSTISCGGIGLCVFRAASVAATTVRIEDSARSGVLVEQLSQLLLSDADIIGGEVGLCFEEGAQHLQRVLERVRFQGQPVHMRPCPVQTGD